MAAIRGTCTCGTEESRTLPTDCVPYEFGEIARPQGVGQWMDPPRGASQVASATFDSG
jgi:hypothetical protein